MLTDCAAKGLDESSSQVFRRVQHAEPTERVIETVGARFAEVERRTPRREAEYAYPGSFGRNERQLVAGCVAEWWRWRMAGW